jgi:hypothetical protein
MVNNCTNINEVNNYSTSDLKQLQYLSPQTTTVPLTSNNYSTSHLKQLQYLSPQTTTVPLTSNNYSISHLKQLQYLSPQTTTVPLTSNHWTLIKTITYSFENPGAGSGQAQKCEGVKPVNGIPPLSLLILQIKLRQLLKADGQ